MGTTKQHYHRSNDHSSQYEPSCKHTTMDTYIPPYSTLHRVAPFPPTPTLQQRLEAPQPPPRRPPQYTSTDRTQSPPYSPTTLAERLDLPARSPATADRCISSTSNEADYKLKTSIGNNSKYRKTPYSRRIINERLPDDARTVARNYKKGNYERPASLISSHTSSSSSTVEAPRTSSFEPSSFTSTSTSPPSASKAHGSYNNKSSSDRPYNPHKVVSFSSNSNSTTVNPRRRREERTTRSLEESNDFDDDGEQVKKKKKIGLNVEDSGCEISLVERISPPSTTSTFKHLSVNQAEDRIIPVEAKTDEAGEHPLDDDGTTAATSVSQQHKLEVLPLRSHYVYEPRRSSSCDDGDTFEEGELIEENEQSSNRGTKVLIGNLEPGTTIDDVAAVFQHFGEIIGAYTSPADFSGDLEVGDSILLVFATEEGANLAISKMNGVLADGRKLSVALAG